MVKENEIWEFVDKALKPPADPTALAAHQKKGMKTKKIILDGAKDHVVPHLSRKNTAKEMWEALTKLY